MNRRSAALLAVLLQLVAAAVAGESRRIVAIGDIHGAYDELRSILLEAKLIDPEENWAGGDAILVQTGDFLDRGDDSIRVALWLMELQQQALEDGGEVVVLLGNHESMNLMGDDRFIPPEMLEPMVDEGSHKRLLEMCRERASILRQSAKALKQKASPASALRKVCLDEHSLGWVEYQEALRPGEALGGWIRSLPAMVLLEGTLFVHGGLSPDQAIRDLEEINRQVRQEIESFDRWRRWLIDTERMVESATLVEMARAVQVELDLREQAAGGDEEAAESALPADVPDLTGFFEMSQHLLLSQDGPLWFRGYDSWSEKEGLEKMPELLESVGACRVVVGHTPQDPRRIRARFEGRVFLIDTGMLQEYYGGVPAALEFLDDRIEAIYLDERVVLSSAPLKSAKCRR